MKQPGCLRVWASLALGALAACSGGGGGGSGGDDFDTSLKAFQAAARTTAQTLGGTIGKPVADLVATKGSTATEGFSEFESQIGSAVEDVCGELDALADDAEDGDKSETRLSSARSGAEDELRDSVLKGLLSAVLERGSDTEAVLDALGVQAAASDGTVLKGTAALKQVALLDDAGKLAFPERGSDAYTRYERWGSGEGAGLFGIVSLLLGDEADRLADCGSSG